MNALRTFSLTALALSLALAAASSATAQVSASAQLQRLDKTTYSGLLDAHVDVYAAPDGKGQVGEPKRYPAQLLFERPDRFRITIRPGTKAEYRAVAEAGIVRWLDLSTGLSGKETVENVADPLALALLGAAGELLRFSAAKDLPVSKSSNLSGARLDPRTYGSGVESALVWFGSDGQPVGFEFNMTDRSRVFVAVMAFAQNVPTSPDDFRL